MNVGMLTGGGMCSCDFCTLQGAQNVRCARCSTITSVAPPPPAADRAQLCCSNAQCRVVLMYPRGAGQVQCSVCGNLNDATQANQLGHVVCGGCHVTLAYAFGAQSVSGLFLESGGGGSQLLPACQAEKHGNAAVCAGWPGLYPAPPFLLNGLQVKCSVCEYVTPVASAAARPQQQQQPQQQLGAQGGQQHQQSAATSNKPPPTTTTVLVENPAGLDEVNVAIGVTPKQ